MPVATLALVVLILTFGLSLATWVLSIATLRQLARLRTQLETIAMTEQDLKNALDAISTTAVALVDEVTAVAAGVQNVAGLVAQLQQQQGPVTQAQLDDLATETVAARDSIAASAGKLQDALTKLNAIGAPVPVPAPTPTPVPAPAPTPPDGGSSAPAGSGSQPASAADGSTTGSSSGDVPAGGSTPGAV